MKKTVIALAVSGLLVSVAQAAPQANTFYAGAKAGWASFHDGLQQFDAKHNGDYGINRNSVTYGVFGGYQITPNFAVEAGYDYFGRAKGNSRELNSPIDNNERTAAKHSAHGASISLKASYPVLDNLDAYARVGAALVRSDYYVQNDVVKANRDKAHRLQVSPVFAGGVEYAITPELALRAEYQWLNNVGNAGKAYKNNANYRGTDYRPDVGSVNLGLSYRFGQGAAPVAAAPEVVTKNFAFSSDVLFAFGKSNLVAAGKQALDSANTEINNLGLANPAIQVNGYADRIGKDAPNLKLSQRRAETVANYLVSKGQNPASVTAVGYGEANPVTGNTCDAVKGRKALIACLAPDRRVEVQVQGSKQEAM